MFKNLRNSNGSALVIALLMMVMLSFLTIASVTTSVQDMDISYNTKEKTKAFYLAEAGIERAIAQLNSSVSWRGGYSNVSFGGGTYSVTVQDSLTDATLDSNVRLVSTGSIAFGESVIESILKPAAAPNSMFKWAIFGDKKTTVSGQGLYDMYDSDLGTYGSQAVNGPDGGGYMYADMGGDIGGNGKITLSGQVYIHGDVLTSNTDLDNGSGIDNSDAVIYGNASTTSPEYVLDSIPQALVNAAMASNSAPAGLTMAGGATFNNGSKELNAPGGSTITFQSGTYYFSKMDLGQANIQVAPGATVKIYVTGDFTASGTTINTSGLPKQFQVYSKGNTVTLSGDSDMKAAIYSPYAVVSVSGTGQLYGSFIGKEANYSGPRQVHYDLALSRLNMPWAATATGGYTQIKWREIY